MKTKYRIILLSVILLGIISGAFLWRGTWSRGRAASSEQFPPVTIPGIPTTGDYCIYRINKTFHGEITTQIERTSYSNCEDNSREWSLHSPTQISLELTESPECSTSLPSFPDLSYLDAEGGAITQENGFALFSGEFSLRVGRYGPALFKGTMELLGRVGSHHTLGESCAEIQHLEGWMVGQGQGFWSKYTLRATIVAEASFPEGPINASTANRITGAIVKAP